MKDKVNILLVDDQPEGLLALESVLEGLNQNLVKARSGREALKQLLDADFALILLDIQMPVMDGFETAALIRERERSRFTPIIFLTAAHKSETQVFKGYEMGAVDYLLKPIVPEVLRSKVSVFVELARKSELVKQQAVLLEKKNSALKEAQLLAARNEERELILHKLQHAVNARDQFLSIASHELKTPLTSIKLLAQTLLRKLKKESLESFSADELARRLQAIDEQVEQMTKLVNDLLDVSRIGYKRLDFSLEETDLSSIVKSVVARLSDDLKGADCKVNVEVDEVIVGLWDKMRLDQIVTNLLSNAIKYGKGKPIEVMAHLDSSHASITVRDHGIGIAQEDQSRIFDRFERAVSSQHYGGIGLGLWIVKQIVGGLKGTVEVESVLGVGSTFKVTLPRVLKAKVQTETRQGRLSVVRT